MLTQSDSRTFSMVPHIENRKFTEAINLHLNAIAEALDVKILELYNIGEAAQQHFILHFLKTDWMHACNAASESAIGKPCMQHALGNEVTIPDTSPTNGFEIAEINNRQ